VALAFSADEVENVKQAEITNALKTRLTDHWRGEKNENFIHQDNIRHVCNYRIYDRLQG
jgi:hypothetical protein